MLCNISVNPNQKKGNLMLDTSKNETEDTLRLKKGVMEIISSITPPQVLNSQIVNIEHLSTVRLVVKVKAQALLRHIWLD